MFIVQYLLQAESRSQMLELQTVSVVAESLTSGNPDVREAALMALAEVSKDSDGQAQMLQVSCFVLHCILCASLRFQQS